jgi:hypothetical protein
MNILEQFVVSVHSLAMGEAIIASQVQLNNDRMAAHQQARESVCPEIEVPFGLVELDLTRNDRFRRYFVPPE